MINATLLQGTRALEILGRLPISDLRRFVSNGWLSLVVEAIVRKNLLDRLSIADMRELLGLPPVLKFRKDGRTVSVEIWSPDVAMRHSEFFSDYKDDEWLRHPTSSDAEAITSDKSLEKWREVMGLLPVAVCVDGRLTESKTTFLFLGREKGGHRLVWSEKSIYFYYGNPGRPVEDMRWPLVSDGGPRLVLVRR